MGGKIDELWPVVHLGDWLYGCHKVIHQVDVGNLGIHNVELVGQAIDTMIEARRWIDEAHLCGTTSETVRNEWSGKSMGGMA